MKTLFAEPQLIKAKRNHGMRLQFACPHCKGASTIKTSRTMSETLREFQFQCRDVECSYSFMVQAEAVRSLSPSGKPDPCINIPLSLHARARPERAAAGI